MDAPVPVSIFATVVASFVPGTRGRRHHLDIGLRAASSCDEAVANFALHFAAAHPDRVALSQTAYEVPARSHLTTHWPIDGLSTTETFKPALNSLGRGAELGDVRSAKQRLFAFAMTFCQPNLAADQFSMCNGFVEAHSLKDATKLFETCILADNPGHETMCINGLEVALELLGMASGPRGGVVTEIKTPLRDSATGLISMVVTERFD